LARGSTEVRIGASKVKTFKPVWKLPFTRTTMGPSAPDGPQVTAVADVQLDVVQI